ncbi:hypothetical protein NSU_3178 [Novosphingobium pentaromativorans US6-1]|uniref:Uncharacterized protein n=1 Tax=Novosphingobium pentaromativorans US6-1 TaxID=1088721 RepID=G6EFQ7_9SPHN|nr:hypothetical protein NSU_3178 [Novosphingobium pentaromativorans US6-1]
MATDLILANYLFVDRSFIKGLIGLGLAQLLVTGSKIGLGPEILGTNSTAVPFAALSR